MNELIDTYEFLSGAIKADPLLLLANAVAWLDPIWQYSLDEDEGEDGLTTALLVTRRIFPDIYAQSVEHLRAGETLAVVDQFICNAVTEAGIPLDDVDYLAFGIPLTGLGLVLEEPELYVQRPDLVPILNRFGVHPELAQPDSYSLDLPEGIYKVARIAAESLMAQPDFHWKQVGWTLGWLFGCSGNSLVDYDDESLSDFQPLGWEADEVALAIEMVEEANGILDDAEAGITWLNEQPDRTAILAENIDRIYKQLKKGKKGEHRIELVWPTPGNSDDGTTLTDPQFLFVRPDAA